MTVEVPPPVRQDVAAVEREYRVLLPKVEAYVKSVQALLASLFVVDGIEVSRIDGRAKEIASLVQKYAKRSKYAGLRDVRDLAGVRVVCYYPADVLAVDQVIEREFRVVERQRHGGPASRDAFGYGSLHLIARITPQRQQLTEYSPFKDLVAEIQVRTVLEDAWAVISHKLDYKSAAEVPKESRRTLFRAAALLETSDSLFDQFRDEVNQARATYRTELASNRSGEVVLNLESLLEAWPQLGIDRVQQAAIENGFRDPDDYLNPEPIREQLGRLVDVAAAAGLERLGDLEEIASGIELHGSTLRHIANRSEENGFAPWGFPADVLAILIGATTPHAIAELESASLAPEILDAIESLNPEVSTGND